MNCEQFEQSIADYLEGALDDAAQEALMSHVEGCDRCRRELQFFMRQDQELERYFGRERERVERIVNPLAPTAAPGGRRRSFVPRRWAWAAAAAVFIAMGGGVWHVWRLTVPMGNAALATLRQADGDVLVLRDGDYRMAFVGQTIHQGERLKVVSGGYAALTLADDNLLEVRGGTQLTLAQFPDRFEVQMHRGQLWAHLPVHPPHPFVVRTPQLTATARGTVYGVEQELDRSIVRVADGTVEVADGGVQTDVTAGETYNSLTDAATPTSTDAIAWSRNRDDLGALAEADEQAAGPTTTALADPAATPTPTPVANEPAQPVAPIEDLTRLLPDDTRFVVDLRDWLSLTDDFRRTDYSRLLNEPNIEQWLRSMGGQQIIGQLLNEMRLLEVLDIVRSLDGQIVAGLSWSDGNDADARPRFVLLADCRTTAEQLRQNIDRLLVEDADGVVNPATVSRSRAEINRVLRIVGGRMVFSSDEQLLGETLRRMETGEPTVFDTGAFHGKIVDNVGDAPLVVALDLSGILDPIRPRLDAASGAAFDFLGAGSLDYALIAPRFKGAGMSQAARLGFKNKRAGVLDWLAKPGPMRGLDFFSPEVNLFGAVVLTDPRVAYYDMMLNFKDMPAMSVPAIMLRFLGEHTALLDSIGNEIAIGLENPVMPVPNVKVVVELRDPEVFREHFNGLVDQALTLYSLAGNALVVVETTEYKGRTIYTIVAEGVLIELSWAFVDDFLVLGPGPRFVEHSIDVHESGRSIASDARLLGLLPSSTGATFSLLVYQNIAKIVGELVNSRLVGGWSSQERLLFPDLSFLSRYDAPGIAYAYADDSTIDFYLNTPKGIDLNMGMAIPVVQRWLDKFTGFSGHLELTAETERRLDQIAAAAMLFRQDFGRWPVSLAELSDGVSQAIPADPFGLVAGDTLRLVAGPEPDQVTLYSIGPDGTDDGGTIAYNPIAGADSPGDILIRLPLEEPAAEPTEVVAD
jgi:ferric-dicitrate binding protein FerR (iron transport regulator)